MRAVAQNKMVELEATRGLAAVVVTVHHLMLAFFPQLHGLVGAQGGASFIGTPFFSVINGSAAVVLFFILSGFVLTLRSFESRSFAPLIVGAIRRWPRLAVPVLIVNLVSGGLVALALYQNQAVAHELGSIWFSSFFPTETADFGPIIWRAAKEGAASTFVRGYSYFNPNLWTMSYEFYGSYLAFACAGLVLYLPRSSGAILVAVAICVCFVSPFFVCFVIGVGLAQFYNSFSWIWFARWSERRSGLFWAVTAVLIAVLSGYHELLAPTRPPVGLYSAIEPLYLLSPIGVRVALHSMAATLILLIVLALKGPKRSLSGPVGSLLGRLSFPIYLVQIPVISSIGAATYAWGGSPTLACFVSFAVIGLVAIPLMQIEFYWLSVLSALTGSVAITKRKVPVSQTLSK